MIVLHNNIWYSKTPKPEPSDITLLMCLAEDIVRRIGLFDTQTSTSYKGD